MHAQPGAALRLSWHGVRLRLNVSVLNAEILNIYGGLAYGLLQKANATMIPPGHGPPKLGNVIKYDITSPQQEVK